MTLFGVKQTRSIQEFLMCPMHGTCEKLDFIPRKERPRSLALTQPLRTDHEATL
jgi:hypothetical protein